MQSTLRMILTPLALALISLPAQAALEDDSLCVDTGGAWTSCGSGCGPYTCDYLPPSLGGEPMMCPSVCDSHCVCSEDAPLWDETLGCVGIQSCEDVGGQDSDIVMCTDTGGVWLECGSGCGPATCDNPPPNPDDGPIACPAVCMEQCGCPAEAPLWNATVGCVAADTCDADSPAGQQALCADTGGGWTSCGTGCGPMACDDDPDNFIVCDAVCVSLCACPETAPYWDDVLGCMTAEDCGLGENPFTDDDSDGYTSDVDCNDGDAAIHPDAIETCNGIDDDCDGELDEGACANAGPCDDGSTDLCDMEPPTCDEGLIVAIQDGCFVCVDPETCEGSGGGEEPTPPGMDLCESVGGTWDWCGSGCGPFTCDNLPPTEGDEPLTCPDVCVEQCMCPGDMPLWDDDKGCIPQSACGTDSPQETLCKDTGGTWNECGSLCPVTCDADGFAGDVVCDDGCLEQCDCPGDQPIWHETLGCVSSEACDADEVDVDMDGYPEGTDCDDANAGIYPGATEVCNEVDDNCDGEVDEGCALQAEKNLCSVSNGTWNACGSGCGPYTCDHLPPAPGESEACLAVCVAMCDCPADAPLWDAEAGCVPETICGDPATDPEADPDSGESEAPEDSSGGCAGGGETPHLLWLGLLMLAWTTRRRVVPQR